MCGIFVTATRELFDRASFSKSVELTDMVRHRGPSDSGYATWNVKHAQGHDVDFDVFLGSRRLSILDLSSAGHQAHARWEGTVDCFQRRDF
jgi:asparagine synthase (glutamine-hydrolysing)